jgi:hypothetical protein
MSLLYALDNCKFIISKQEPFPSTNYLNFVIIERQKTMTIVIHFDSDSLFSTNLQRDHSKKNITFKTECGQCTGNPNFKVEMTVNSQSTVTVLQRIDDNSGIYRNRAL